MVDHRGDRDRLSAWRAAGDSVGGRASKQKGRYWCAFVFGALGEQVGNPKKGWETCVLRAHGHEPLWVRRGTLSKASRTELAAVDLHFHDLRHEAGCRWLEQGWPIHHVQEMLVRGNEGAAPLGHENSEASEKGTLH